MRPYLILWWQVKKIVSIAFAFTNGIINHAVDCRLSTMWQKRGHEGKFTIRSRDQTSGRGYTIHRIGSRCRDAAIVPMVTVIAFRCRQSYLIAIARIQNQLVVNAKTCCIRKFHRIGKNGRGKIHHRIVNRNCRCQYF